MLISGMYNLVDGSLVHKLRLDNISNNLANISTNAFKKDNISFNQTLTMKHYSKTDFTPGPANYTGNDLDVALDSHGFFKIQTSRGIRYTRNGSFALNLDRLLVTRSGDTVLGKSGPIQINGNKISIESNGQVVVDDEPVDEILVVDVKKPQFLKKEGGTYYKYEGEKGDIFTAENILIRQSHIERSNVNLTEEMIMMVEALRAFESAQKAIQVIDEITGKIVNDPALFQ